MQNNAPKKKESSDIGGTLLAITTEEKNLEVLISDDCKMRKQCTLALEKANTILGYITKGILLYV